MHHYAGALFPRSLNHVSQWYNCFMRVYLLEIRHFRGFKAAPILPVDHVVLVGEPRAGRSDIIDALDRVLSPDSTRGRLPTELDFYGRDITQRAEVEVVLGGLGPELEQLFLDQLELWSLKDRQLVDELADPTRIDREQYDLVVRLCYRASWDAKEEQAEHWVDYPKSSDPETGHFERVGRPEREALPFAAIEARSRPLDIGTRGEFRRLVETTEGDDFSRAVDELEREIVRLAEAFSATTQVSAALDAVLLPLRTVLRLGALPAAEIIRFLPEGGSISGLLRSLSPAVKLEGSIDLLPLHRHGSTVIAMLSVAQAVARAGVGGVVAVDDFGEGLDASTAHHLAATLRRSASQVWLSTRRPQVAEVFPPSELIRLARQKGAVRSVHYGRAPKTKAELLAARHWHLQLLPAMASRAVVIVEGPHDRAALTALARRLHDQEDVPLPAASGVTLVDAAAADGAGGLTAIPRLAETAKNLGFWVISILDHDGDDARALAEVTENVKCADAVVRLPKGCAIELALLQGVDDAVIRAALKELRGAFGVPLPPDIDTLAPPKLIRLARDAIKHGPGYHAQFIDALPPGTHPPLARRLLETALNAANGNADGLIQL